MIVERHLLHLFTLSRKNVTFRSHFRQKFEIRHTILLSNGSTIIKISWDNFCSSVIDFRTFPIVYEHQPLSSEIDSGKLISIGRKK